MKKRLIAALLTAGLLFSFGTTAFAEVSDEQTLDTDSAGSIVTQDSTEQKDEGIVLLDGETKDPAQEIATQATKEGFFGYYLSNEKATWPLGEDGKEMCPAGVVQYIDDKGKVKYREKNTATKDSTTTVTDVVPVLKDHAFLGWGDKKRGDDNPAAIRRKDDTLTYCYKEGRPYTLDALWGSLSIEGGTKVYDGEPFTLTAATFALNNEGLSSEYATQYQKLLGVNEPIEYSIDGKDDGVWTNDLNSFKFVSAGTYTLYARQVVKVIYDDPDNPQPVTVEGKATYTIDPRPVTLTSASATKEYDGQPLTNDDVTAAGFVDDEGATYTVTGTQTEVGSSENTFTYALNSDTLERNYKITTNYGTLTVTAKTTPDPVDPNPGTTPTPTPTATTAPTAAPSTDDTTPENTATPAPTATAAPTATPTPAPTAAPAAARAATTIPQTGDNFPAVTLVIVMLAAILGLGITIVIRAGKKK